MSNFIPMVSSSPPPLEDTGGFDDWDDDDDFGTFTGANNDAEFTAFSSAGNSDVWQNQNSESSEQEFGKFANSENCSDENEILQKNSLNMQNDLDTTGKPLNLDFQTSSKYVINNNSDLVPEHSSESEDTDNDSENLKNITRTTTRDSGLCSIDISPGQRSDDIKVTDDKSGSDGEEIYDSQSEDSTSKDISESTDLNSKVCINENDACLSETNNIESIPQTENARTEKSENEGNSFNTSNSRDTLPLSSSAKLVSDPEYIGEHSTSEQNEQNLSEDKFTSSQESRTCSDSHNSSETENELVAQGKSKVFNPPTSVSCDNSSEMKDSGIEISESSPPVDCMIEDIKAVSDDVKCDNELNLASENSKHSFEGQRVLEESADCHHSLNEKENLESEESNLTTSDLAYNELKLTSSDSENLQDEQTGGIENNFVDSETPQKNFESQQTESKNEEGKHLNSDLQIDSCNDSTSQDGKSNSSDTQNQDEDVKRTENEHSEGPYLQKSSHDDVSFISQNEKSETSIEDKQSEISQDHENDDDFEDFSDFQAGSELELPPLDNTLSEDTEKNAESDDDLNDFADFQTDADLKLPPLQNFEETDEVDDNDNDFGELSESKDDKSWGFGSFNEGDEKKDIDDDDDDWANFQESSVSVDEKGGFNDDDVDENDDDFGDFGEFSSNTEFVSASKPQESAKTVTAVKSEPARQELDLKTKIFSRQRKISESIVDDVVEEMVTVSDVDDLSELSALGMLESCLQLRKNTALSLRASVQKSKEDPVLWKKLQNLNATTAIKYQWPESRVNKTLFKTLRIDTQNILLGHKKQSVPIYASNLTMLEPTKGPIASKAKTEEQLVDTDNKTEQNSNMDIPPVQFDWTTSGLTNPLEENRKTLGLDFLVVQEMEATTKSTVLSGDQGTQETKTNLQPLENILATLKVSTVKKTKHTENLSEEAARIITSLPDLSFMHSKVLMFPLRQENNT